MKQLLILILVISSFTITAQIDTLKQRMIPMSATIEKPHDVGSVYYQREEKKPFTGVLYGKYDNGNYLTIQEYKNGVGNGKWVNYYENGTIKEIGNYNNNRVEGSIKQFYPNGTLKAEGTYKHWKKKVGVWKYYNNKGELEKTVTYN